MSRILRQLLVEKIGADKNKKILSKKSNRFLNTLLIVWVISSALLTYQANESSWDSKQCVYCNKVASIVPSIDKVLGVSHYPNAMRIQWLFLTISSPIVLMILLISIRDVRKGDVRPFAFWFSTTASIFAIYVAWTGALLGFGTNYYARLYRESLYGGILFTSAVWLSVVIFVFYVIVYIQTTFKD